MVQPVAHAEIWNHTNDEKVADLVLADPDGWGRRPIELQGQLQHNQPGSGYVTVRRTHPSVLPLTAGNVLRLYMEGEPVFAVDLEAVSEAVLRKAKKDEKVKVSGDGLLGRWRHSVVDPWLTTRPVSFTRVWNWASPPLDTTAWEDTVYNQTWEDSVGWSELPEAWPVPPEFCSWIWSRAEDPVQPVGSSPFRFKRYFSNPATIVIYIGANSTPDVWFDGVLLEREPNKQPDKSGYESTWRYVVPVEPGWHHLGILGTNWGGSESDNPAGVANAVYTINTGSMVLDDLLWVSHEEQDWVCLDYPEVLPGFTAPQILQMLLDEAQARGELEGWTIDAVGDFDEIEEFACRVGDSYLKVIESLADTYVDVACDPEGLVLRLWPKSVGQGTASGVEITQGANLVEKSIDWDGEYWNAVQGLWEQGVRWREDAASLAVRPRRSKPLELGAVGSSRAVNKILAEFLAANAEPVPSISAEVICDEGSMAGIDYKIGDTLDLDGDTVRLLGLTLTADQRGTWRVGPEFDSLLAARRKEKTRSVERLRASYEAASSAPLVNPNALIQSGKVSLSAFVWPWSGDINEELFYDETEPGRLHQPFRMDRTGRVYEVSIEIDPSNLPDATGNTTFELMKNLTVVSGVPELTLTDSSARAVFKIYGTVVGTPKDIWNVRLKDDGDGSVIVGNHIDGNITMKYADSI